LSNLSLQQKIQLPNELVAQIFCFVLDNGYRGINERFVRLSHYKSQFLKIIKVCNPWRNFILNNVEVLAKLLDDIFISEVDEPDLESLKESGFYYQSPRTWYNVTTPVHFAAALGIDDLVKYYLTIGNCNVGDFYGSTPLHYAAAHGKLSIIRILLVSQETDINAKDCKGMTPMMCALEVRNSRVMLLLLNYPKISLGKSNVNGFQVEYYIKGIKQIYYLEDRENIISEYQRLQKYVTIP